MFLRPIPSLMPLPANAIQPYNALGVRWDVRNVGEATTTGQQTLRLMVVYDLDWTNNFSIMQFLIVNVIQITPPTTQGDLMICFSRYLFSPDVGRMPFRLVNAGDQVTFVFPYPPHNQGKFELATLRGYRLFIIDARVGGEVYWHAVRYAYAAR